MDAHAPRIMPVAFVSHGAPTLALDATKGADLARWASTLPRPRAVVVVSAHWEATPVTLGTVDPRELLYDFGGFGPELHEITYAAPGAPELAEDVAGRIPGVRREAGRPWDHGVWVPLVHMFPDRDVPVLQLSLPSESAPSELIELGRALQPLRESGVLILASGGLVHNLRRLDWTDRGAPETWATDFEAWIDDVLARRDLDALADFRTRAPGLARAHPTLEHFMPLLVAVGASTDADMVRSPVRGFEYGSLSRRALEFSV